MLVLGIAAALIIAAFVIYPKAQAAQKTTAEVSNLNAIAAGLRGLYSGSSDYSTLSNVTAANAKVFPDAMVSSTGAVTNGWGGDVSVNSGGTLYTNGFQIDYSGIPSDSCTKFATSAAPNFSLIYVNGTQIRNMATKVDLDPAVVSTACSSVTNTVTFFDR